MAKFKQEQIIPGVTKTRSNALKVYCAEAIAENDIIVATGMQGDFLSVVKADANVLTKCRGPFFVADFAGASGEYLPLAVERKVITDKDTSAAAQVGDAVYLSAATAGLVTLGSVPAATATSIASAIASAPSAPSSAASAATRQTAALWWQAPVAPSACSTATNSWAPYHRRHHDQHPSHNFPLYV